MQPYDIEKLISQLPLGKTTGYIDHYDNSLLKAVPRELNRQPLGILSNQLPFIGSDLWNLYELSWLNNKGLPQVAIGEVIIDANSANLIESKSFKLYLNSFNQTRFENWQHVTNCLQNDLTDCAKGVVSVKLYPLSAIEGQKIIGFNGVCIDDIDIEISDYQYRPDLLSTINSTAIVEETLVSHLLKSNCLITQQPDWGSIQIHYSGQKIDHASLLRYLVSFRHHNEFHEQCVERIYCDIQKYCQPEWLTVYARYTRRGGLDINPLRTNRSDHIHLKQRLTRQ